MKVIGGFFKLVGWLVSAAVRLTLIVTILAVARLGAFVHHKGSQPMDVERASPPLPEGITYWQFMSDRFDAAQEIEPQRCGVGKLTFFAVSIPVYSVIYTVGGMRPESALGSGIQPDPSIPHWAAGLPWEKSPDVWWWVVENISWGTLAKKTIECNFRPVAAQY